ncbi:MAG: formimidoylglutamase [Cyanothece sp. SIO1E1]|nr:formimidoylglutamase [Cyanothece sp. SIO1E1]
MISKLYKPCDPKIWKGRVDSAIDPKQFRWHQVVRIENAFKLEDGSEKVLLGFPCDVGVERNRGRLGAAEGPDYFRESVGSLCWHGDEAGFVDIGNIYPDRNNLEEAQVELGKLVHVLLQKQKIPCIIGGGHETAFGHYLGIASYLKETKPDAKLGIVNIDAHFDLRSYDELPNSGTPFLQALDHAVNNDTEAEYFVYGINPQNNTKSLFETADRFGVKYVINQKVNSNSMQSIEKLESFIQDKTHIYLTICLDVFEVSIAPGVSAPAWQGVKLSHAQQVLNLIKKSGRMISMDVCELNPRYDHNTITAKTAGMLVAGFMDPN